jgi:aryl-alcohol dehydrogenase-like predicted oxidoreductase
MMAAAYDAGVNFFDNAEVYAGGRSEEIMGAALKQLAWPRLNYVVSTKFFWGLDRNGDAVNRKDTLNRKYLMQAMDGSLKRMGLEHIDLIYCHRPDPHTPVEETVRAMSDLITQGKALYWGTSEWSAGRHPRGLGDRRPPPPAQAGDGAAAVPPVPPPARGAGIRAPVRRHRPGPDHLEPAGQRPAHRQVPRRRARRQPRRDGEHGLPARRPAQTRKNAAVAALEPIAAELGGTVAQLAIAWVARNPRVSTVITGASKLSQLQSNLGALALVDKLTPEVLARIDSATAALAGLNLCLSRAARRPGRRLPANARRRSRQSAARR